MIDERQEHEPEPPVNGQETSLRGASEWTTVPAASVEAGAPIEAPGPEGTTAAARARDAESYPLEPLPQAAAASSAGGSESAAPTGPPVPAQGPGTNAPTGYAPVYGSAGQQQPPPPSPNYGASGTGYPPPPPPPYGAPGYGGPGGPSYPPPPPPPPGQGISSTAAAAISYLTFIPAVIFLVLEPYNRDRFIRFHAWQCIALTVVWIVIGIIFRVLGFVGLHLLWWVIHSFIMLALFVFWLIALVKASQGQWYRIPIVGDLADSFIGKQ